MTHRLILVEGLPGAGKTTTALWLAKELRQRGNQVDLVLENDHPSPLPLPGGAPDLRGIIRTFARGNPLLPAWRRFVSDRDPQAIAIVEARFWQDNLMFMRLGNRTCANLAAAQAEVCAVILPLSPLLIWFQHSWDALRESNARKIASDPAWAAIAMAAFTDQPWFHARPGPPDMSAFYDDWSLQAAALAQLLPFPIQPLDHAHGDWEATYGTLGRLFWRDGK